MLNGHCSSKSISKTVVYSTAQHADMMTLQALEKRWVALQYAVHLRGKWQPLSARKAFHHAAGSSCSWQLLRINPNPGGSCLSYAHQLDHHCGLFLVRTAVCEAANPDSQCLPASSTLYRCMYGEQCIIPSTLASERQSQMTHSMLQPTGQTACRPCVHL